MLYNLNAIKKVSILELNAYPKAWELRMCERVCQILLGSRVEAKEPCKRSLFIVAVS